MPPSYRLPNPVPIPCHTGKSRHGCRKAAALQSEQPGIHITACSSTSPQIVRSSGTCSPPWPSNTPNKAESRLCKARHLEILLRGPNLPSHGPVAGQVTLRQHQRSILSLGDDESFATQGNSQTLQISKLRAGHKQNRLHVLSPAAHATARPSHSFAIFNFREATSITRRLHLAGIGMDIM